jgi:hypothetical protein
MAATEATSARPGRAHPGERRQAIDRFEAWQTLVIGRLWAGQRALQEDPELAYFHWSVAIRRMSDFYETTPEDHPNHLKLHKLIIDVTSIPDLLAARSPDTISDPLLDRLRWRTRPQSRWWSTCPGNLLAGAGAPGAAESAGSGSSEADRIRLHLGAGTTTVQGRYGPRAP